MTEREEQEGPQNDVPHMDEDGRVLSLEDRIDRALALEAAHDKWSETDERVSTEILAKFEKLAQEMLQKQAHPSTFVGMAPPKVVGHARKIVQLNARIQKLGECLQERSRKTRRVRVIRAVHVEYDVENTLTDEEAIEAVWMGETRAKESWRNDYDELVGKHHCQVIVLDGESDEDPPWPKDFDIDSLI